MATPRGTKRAAARNASVHSETREETAVATPGRGPLRVLALDGGPAALLVTLMLDRLEQLAPGFLANVDVIAGTSAGAITGLMLATKDDPALMLPVAQNFWSQIQDYYKNSLFGYLRALTGFGPFNDSKYVQEFLEQRGVLAGKKLKDLSKRVVVTSFDISMGEGGGGEHKDWRPKVFHNLLKGGHDMNVRAVDAALSSSASPIATAVHEGKVDGGLIANNPSLVAIGQLFEVGRSMSARGDYPEDVTGVVMLSVGGGHSEQAFHVTNAQWGYFQWLLDPRSLLLLLNGFLSGTTKAIARESWQILAYKNFRRLDPPYSQPGLLPFVQADPKRQRETASSPTTEKLLEDTADWLKKSGWVRAVSVPELAAVGD